MYQGVVHPIHRTGQEQTGSSSLQLFAHIGQSAATGHIDVSQRGKVQDEHLEGGVHHVDDFSAVLGDWRVARFTGPTGTVAIAGAASGFLWRHLVQTHGLVEGPSEEQTCGKVQGSAVPENPRLRHLHGIPVLVEVQVDSRRLWHIAQQTGVRLQALDVQGQEGNADANEEAVKRT